MSCAFNPLRPIAKNDFIKTCDRYGVFEYAQLLTSLALIAIVSYAAFCPLSNQVVGGSIIGLSGFSLTLQLLQTHSKTACTGSSKNSKAQQIIETCAFLAIATVGALVIMGISSPSITFWSVGGAVCGKGVVKQLFDFYPNKKIRRDSMEDLDDALQRTPDLEDVDNTGAF